MRNSPATESMQNPAEEKKKPKTQVKVVRHVQHQPGTLLQFCPFLTLNPSGTRHVLQGDSSSTMTKCPKFSLVFAGKIRSFRELYILERGHLRSCWIRGCVGGQLSP
jgi:hypothetical protein